MLAESSSFAAAGKCDFFSADCVILGRYAADDTGNRAVNIN